MFVAEWRIVSDDELLETILQWGRNMFVAECPVHRRHCLQRLAPSMGPQHVRCGMTPDPVRTVHTEPPSMGPQHVRCGMA